MPARYTGTRLLRALNATACGKALSLAASLMVRARAIHRG
jgi:hypothetical protein